MKATGIVRKIDDLGRIVIPKDIRKNMGIGEGDSIEMFIDTENGGLVLMAYHSEVSNKINAIAESLNSIGATPEHWAIAEELKNIAIKLEKLQ